MRRSVSQRMRWSSALPPSIEYFRATEYPSTACSFSTQCAAALKQNRLARCSAPQPHRLGCNASVGCASLQRTNEPCLAALMGCLSRSRSTRQLSSMYAAKRAVARDWQCLNPIWIASYRVALKAAVASASAESRRANQVGLCFAAVDRAAWGSVRR